jgi:hypothetical protein
LNKTVSELSVMKSCCKTCPFKDEGNGFQDSKLAKEVIKRNLFNSQQVCHVSEGKNRKANNRCKGYYDYSFKVYQDLGLEPEKHFLNQPNR